MNKQKFAFDKANFISTFRKKFTYKTPADIACSVHNKFFHNSI